MSRRLTILLLVGLVSITVAVRPDTHSKPLAPPTPTPAVVKPVQPTRLAHGVDISKKQSIDTLKCFLDPKHANHHVKDEEQRTGTGPKLTKTQLETVASRTYDRLGVRMPMQPDITYVKDPKTGKYVTDPKTGKKKTIKTPVMPFDTIRNAISAGYSSKNIGVYYIDFAPSEGAEKGVERLKSVAKQLAEVKDSFSTLWLDIEGKRGKGKAWLTDQSENCKYITAIVKAIKSDKVTFPWKLGIYSGPFRFPAIAGRDCDFTEFKDLPFWFAAWVSGDSKFDWFPPMKNGWQKGAVHQWRGTTTFCNTWVDFDAHDLDTAPY